MIALAVIASVLIATIVITFAILSTARRPPRSQSLDIAAMKPSLLQITEQRALQRWTRDASLVLESILRDDEMIPSLHDRRRKEIEDLVGRYRDDD